MTPVQTYDYMLYMNVFLYDTRIRHFPQKSPIISGVSAERDLQLKASYAFLPPCTYLTHITHMDYSNVHMLTHAIKMS